MAECLENVLENQLNWSAYKSNFDDQNDEVNQKFSICTLKMSRKLLIWNSLDFGSEVLLWGYRSFRHYRRSFDRKFEAVLSTSKRDLLIMITDGKWINRFAKKKFKLPIKTNIKPLKAEVWISYDELASLEETSSSSSSFSSPRSLHADTPRQLVEEHKLTKFQRSISGKSAHATIKCDYLPDLL